MKTKIILFAIACFAVISCNTQPKQSGNEEALPEETIVKTVEEVPLTTVKTTVTGTGDNQLTNEEISTNNDAYFEISLNQSTSDEGVHYIASKYLERSTSLENFKLVILSIGDETGEIVQYSNSTEFLNYMDERNYELVEKKDFDLRTDYVFKRKE